MKKLILPVFSLVVILLVQSCVAEQKTLKKAMNFDQLKLEYPYFLARKILEANAKYRVVAERSDSMAISMSSPFYTTTEGFSPFTINETWKPKRYFGNFQSGSDLEELQFYVYPYGSSEIPVASFHFNNFFSDFSDTELDIYKLYFRKFYEYPLTSAVIPKSTTGEISYSSGIDPSPFILQLDHITYSNKYGGSVMFSFELADYQTPNNTNVQSEVYGTELRAGDYCFDINNLRANIYVKPGLNRFNPLASNYLEGDVFVEVEPNEVITYLDGNLINDFEDSSNYTLFLNLIDNLENSLKETSLNYETYAEPRSNLITFAHGWIHSQFTDLIESTQEKVDNLWLSENFCDLVSSDRTAVIFPTWKIDNIKGPWVGGLTDLFEGDEEFRVKVIVSHSYGASLPKLIVNDYTLYIDEWEDSRWLSLGGFSVDELDRLEFIEVEIQIRELDVTSADDVYPPISVYFTVDNTLVDNKLNQTIWVGKVPNAMVVIDNSNIWYSDYEEGILNIQNKFGTSADISGEIRHKSKVFISAR